MHAYAFVTLPRLTLKLACSPPVFQPCSPRHPTTAANEHLPNIRQNYGAIARSSRRFWRNSPAEMRGQHLTSISWSMPVSRVGVPSTCVTLPQTHHRYDSVGESGTMSYAQGRLTGRPWKLEITYRRRTESCARPKILEQARPRRLRRIRRRRVPIRDPSWTRGRMAGTKSKKFLGHTVSVLRHLDCMGPNSATASGWNKFMEFFLPCQARCGCATGGGLHCGEPVFPPNQNRAETDCLEQGGMASIAGTVWERTHTCFLPHHVQAMLQNSLLRPCPRPNGLASVQDRC